jgi:aminomethyltransferase
VSRQTFLNPAHRRLGAKLVDFGGWEMPLHYGSQIEEHLGARSDAGMFDVSHMLAIDFEGVPSRSLLRYLLANDVERLRTPGKALYSCMLNSEGCVLDDMIVYVLDNERFRIVVNAGTAEKDLDWITEWRDRRFPGVQIRPRRDLAMIAVQGPNAREKVWQAFPDWRPASVALEVFHAAPWREVFLARTGYTGEDGFELIFPGEQAVPIWDRLLDVGVAPAGLGARDTLRIEAGMCLYGQDIDETVTPLESGLAWTVDLRPGREFSGRQALETRPAKTCLRGLVLHERGVLRAHQEVQSSKGAGFVTSGTFSPSLQRSIALARLPVGTGEDESVLVRIRDRMAVARTVKYPFVRHGRSLVTLT